MDWSESLERADGNVAANPLYRDRRRDSREERDNVPEDMSPGGQRATVEPRRQEAEGEIPDLLVI